VYSTVTVCTVPLLCVQYRYCVYSTVTVCTVSLLCVQYRYCEQYRYFRKLLMKT